MTRDNSSGAGAGFRRTSGHLSSAALRARWSLRQTWVQDPEAAREFVNQALDAGEILLACDATRWLLGVAEGKEKPPRGTADGFGCHEGDNPLRLLLASALTQLGATEEARRWLSPLIDQRNWGGRALSLRARSYIADWEWAPDPADRAEFLAMALESYRAVLARDPKDLSAAIHAATLECIRGDREKASQDAKTVLALCGSALLAGENSCEVLAARAGALAIEGHVDEALACFREVASAPDANLPRLAAIRRQARQIAYGCFGDRGTFDGALPNLHLAVFAGHMLDGPARIDVRFPAEREVEVRDLIRARVAALAPQVGFSSAASGADILFLEAMLERGAAVHVMLPWSRDEFVRASVVPDPTLESWRPRFDAVLEKAASIHTLGQWDEPSSGVGFDYCNRVLCGVARLHATSMGLDLLPVALWDGRPGLAGGTGGFVAYWRERGIEPEVILLAPPSAPSVVAASPVAAAPPVPQPRTETDPAVAAVRASIHQEIRAMLFGDIVGYSRLPESAIPGFLAHFMRRVSELISRSAEQPLSIKTWGDAIYAVFTSASAAGTFSLDLRDLVSGTDWKRYGLCYTDPEGHEQTLNLRVGLHAGPVFLHCDPIVRQLDYTGAHVSRAARIEPVTSPGEIFASEEFAALAVGENVRTFACDFIGTTSLAKGYGAFVLYRLRRTTAPFTREALARAIHDQYCHDQEVNGLSPESVPALRPWDDLPETFKRICREQAKDIPAKLRSIGWSLETLRDSAAAFTAEEVERLAEWEHRRWCDDRRRDGWKYAEVRDDARKLHPSLVSWDDLSEPEREKDRSPVRNIPRLVALAGYFIRRDGSVIR